MGLLCAEQNVGNLKQCTFRKSGTQSGTPARRTKRRKSQRVHFQKFWGSCAQNKRRKSRKLHFQEFWGSCLQNKPSEISAHHFHNFWGSCAHNKTSEISKHALSEILGLRFAEKHVGNIEKCTSIISRTPVRRTKKSEI